MTKLLCLIAVLVLTWPDDVRAALMLDSTSYDAGSRAGTECVDAFEFPHLQQPPGTAFHLECRGGQVSVTGQSAEPDDPVSFVSPGSGIARDEQRLPLIPAGVLEGHSLGTYPNLPFEFSRGVIWTNPLPGGAAGAGPADITLAPEPSTYIAGLLLLLPLASEALSFLQRKRRT